MEIDDEKLSEDYLAGDENSFKVIVSRYTRQIYNFAYRLCGNVSESEDITQEVFLKVWKNLKKFDSKKSFKTWIFAIARNTTIDFLRKKKNVVFSDLNNLNEDKSDSFEENLPDLLPLPDALFETKELGLKIEKALNKIPSNYKEIIILHHTNELTFEEISKIILKPMNTVKSQYRRGLIMLRESLVHQNNF